MPARSDWTKTSARSTSRSSASIPRGSLTSSASDRFDAFAAKNITEPPSQNRGPQARASSPRCGCSTLTTSAPSAPRISVAVGPASDEVRSTTRIPASGLKPIRATLAAEPASGSRPGRWSQAPGPAPGQVPGPGSMEQRNAFFAAVTTASLAEDADKRAVPGDLPRGRSRDVAVLDGRLCATGGE